MLKQNYEKLVKIESLSFSLISEDLDPKGITLPFNISDAANAAVSAAGDAVTKIERATVASFIPGCELAICTKIWASKSIYIC